MQFDTAFERLMELVAGALASEDDALTLGDLARSTGEPPERIMHAVDALRRR